MPAGDFGGQLRSASRGRSRASSMAGGRRRRTRRRGTRRRGTRRRRH